VSAEEGARSESVLVVDVANVVGSRPDGWWRDRAGAAARLLDELAGLPGSAVPAPDAAAAGAVVIAEVVAVVEGAASRVSDPAVAGLRLVRAERDGDTAVVETVMSAARSGTPGTPGTPGERAPVLVVTADRGLRQRLPAGCTIAGPRWLLGVLARRAEDGS